MGKNARKSAEGFTIEKYLEELEKIYENVVKKHKI